MRYFRLIAPGLLLAAAAGQSGFAQFIPGRSPGIKTPPVVPGGGKASGKQKNPDEPLADFAGTFRSANRNTLRIQTAESNTVEFHYSRKTQFYDGDRKVKPEALKPGDVVSVEARRAIDGSLEAVNVRLTRPKS